MKNFLLLVLLSLSSSVFAFDADEDVCRGVSCGHGRDCVPTNGAPSCQCARSCPPHAHPVCGTDAAWYPNHCELHRHACILGRAISIDHSEDSCKVTPEKAATKRFREKPVVCYQDERDHLRDLLIQWQAARQLASGLTARLALKKTFADCDGDKNGFVSSLEFLKCSEEDASIRGTPSPDLPDNELSEGDQQKVTILRGLCIDALIDATDDDSNWILDDDEFFSVFDPNFPLPKKRCSLEDRQFEDGSETKVDCNSCNCACGNWVCTSRICQNDVLPPPKPLGEDELSRLPR